mmetsp:Transcript_75296/g.230354  ORF Transcript_75296/g.230354 Transcript_75296/m.230354 type:complete len:220 (-) Transcript_75296:1450-2109(-)
MSCIMWWMYALISSRTLGFLWSTLGAYCAGSPVTPLPLPPGTAGLSWQTAQPSQSGSSNLSHRPAESCFEAQRWLTTTSSIGTISCSCMAETRRWSASALPYLLSKTYHFLGRYAWSSTESDGGGNHIMLMPAERSSGKRPSKTVYQLGALQEPQSNAWNMMTHFCSPKRGGSMNGTTFTSTGSEPGPTTSGRTLSRKRDPQRCTTPPLFKSSARSGPS